MNKERSKRVALEVVGKSILLAFAVQLARNADVWPRVARALSEGYVGYSSNETVDDIGEYNLIAVLGAGGSYLDDSGNTLPGTFEKRRLRATAEYLINNTYWVGNPDVKVLLNDGDVETGESDKKYLEEQVINLSKGKLALPTGMVCVDIESFNTASNIEAVQKFTSEYNSGRVLLITDWFHGARVSLLAENYGLDFDLLTVEKAAQIYNQQELPKMLVLNKSHKMEDLLQKERLGIMWTVFDRTGQLTKVTNKARKAGVDLFIPEP